jgi:putative ABC transport system permease protein
VVLTSLGEGARLYVTAEFAALGSNLLIVTPGKTETTGMAALGGGAPHDLTIEDAAAIARRVPAVRRVAPLSVGTAPGGYGPRRRDVTVFGTSPEMRAIRGLTLLTGRYLPAGDSTRGLPVCVIGSAVRQELFGARSPLGEILRLGDERYRVIGVIAPRGVSIGMDLDEVVHIPVSRALKLFNRSGLDRVLIELRSHEAIPSARARVLGVLEERHGGEEDVTVLTQDSVISTFGGILSVLTAVLAGIAAISLTVAGIGIMNVMLVSVSERTREIGLWKAVGAMPRQITLVFLAEAAMLSLGGGVAGVAASFALERVARAMYPGFPFAPPVWAVSSALGLSIAVGLLSGAMPALRAARLEPTAALARR